MTSVLMKWIARAVKLRHGELSFTKSNCTCSGFSVCKSDVWLVTYEFQNFQECSLVRNASYILGSRVKSNSQKSPLIDFKQRKNRENAYFEPIQSNSHQKYSRIQKHQEGLKINYWMNVKCKSTSWSFLSKIIAWYLLILSQPRLINNKLYAEKN